MPVQLVLQFWEGLLDFFLLYAWFFHIVCRAYMHKSGLCNFGNHSETLLLPFCFCCNLIIINYSAYCCIHCKFFVHGFCLNTSKEITIILLKNYTLFLNTLVNDESKTCNVCDELIEGISLHCNNARIVNFIIMLPVDTPTQEAWNTSLTDDHDLVYLMKTMHCFKCFEYGKRHDYCEDSFYRCSKCNWNVFIEFISLPLVVRH